MGIDDPQGGGGNPDGILGAGTGGHFFISGGSGGGGENAGLPDAGNSPDVVGVGTAGVNGGSGGAPSMGGAGPGGGAGFFGDGSGAGVGGLGGIGGAPPTSAIIGIDFVGGGFSAATGARVMAPTEVAGAKPASHWNSAATSRGTLTPLMLASGDTVPATAAWGSPSTSPTDPNAYRVGFVDAPGDTRMMNGYLDPLSPAGYATVTVSDLPAYITTNGYDVYVYCLGNLANGVSRTYHYSIGTTAFSVIQNGPSPTNFPGYALASNLTVGNYVVFRRVTGSSFVLTAQPMTPMGASAQDPQRSPVNGIQIVWPAEP